MMDYDGWYRTLAQFYEMKEKIVLRGGNLQSFISQDPEIIDGGPAGTGKSFACIWKLHYIAMTVPRVRLLIARKTRKSLTNTGLVTYEEKILGGRQHPILFNGANRSHRERYEYKNGSVIETGGLDYVDKILSSEYDIIYIQQAEEATHEDWEKLSSRLRNYVLPYQQMIGDCNPGPPRHWILNRTATSLILAETKHEDNPLLHDGTTWTETGLDYISRLKRMTGVNYERLFLGKWVSAEGMIFTEWSEEKHVLPHLPELYERTSHYRRFRIIDFGSVLMHAFVCQWWVEIPKNVHMNIMGKDIWGKCYILYRELYGCEKTFAEWAKRIAKLSEKERIDATYCDHDIDGVKTMRNNGVSDARLATKPKTVAAGIDLVKTAMSANEIYIMESCLVEQDARLKEANLPLCTLDEIPAAVYAHDRYGVIMKEDYAANCADHGLKNIAYLLSSVGHAGLNKMVSHGVASH